MDWRIYAVLIVAGFSTCALLMKLSATDISPSAGVIVFSLAMLATAGIFSVIDVLQGNLFTYTSKGMALLTLAGAANTVGDLSLILALRHGNLSWLAPIVDAGTVVTTVILALLVVGEKLDFSHFLGIVMCVVGISILTR